MGLAMLPDLAEIAFLLGTWRGEGEGEWPGTQAFTFGEELVFAHVLDAYLLHTQRSWSLQNDEPIHQELGFLRPAGPGRVELVLAHPLGMAEVAEGTVTDQVIEVAATSVALAGTASGVTELRRRIELEGDELRYELHMAMREIPLTSHIRSRLRRT
jgi:hypothetical protein